ncbi:TonB-dependent receptor [Sphingobium chungangianum]
MKQGKSLSALLCGAAMIVPTAAWAQEAADGGGEIVVTATREARSLQSVPMSVNVATGEQLQKLNIFDAKDVQQLAPGLEMTNTTGRNNSTTLRGISFDPDQGTDPAVQVYFNEIPTDAQTVYTALYDIKQIEVLRGPQGLLRGISAPAGAITISTARPSFDEIEGYAQTTATTRGGYNAQGGVSLPFSDKIALRVAALVDGNRLNNVRNVNTGERSRSRTESARLTLGLRPTENLTAYITYQYLYADNRQMQQVIGSGNMSTFDAGAFLGGALVPNSSTRSGPALGVDDYAAVAEGTSRNINESHIVNLAIDWDLGPATLSFVGAHQDSRLKGQRDLDVGNAVPNYISNSFGPTPFVYDTVEMRLATNNKDGLGGGIGVFYSKIGGTTRIFQPGDSFIFPFEQNDSLNTLGALPYLPIATEIIVPVDRSIWSFNANLNFRRGGLAIEGGLRYSIIKSVNVSRLGLSTPGNSLLCTGDPIVDAVSFGCLPASYPATDIIPANLRNTSDKPITGGLTISYQLMPSINIFASYGHSFRAGSVSPGLPDGMSDDLILTQPEKTDSIEAGVKGSFAGRRLHYAVSVYYQKLDNFLNRFSGIYYQSTVAAPPTGFFDFNYNGDARIKGIEGSLDGRITRDWDFGVSAAYTRARYRNALLPCNDFAGTGRPNRDGAATVTGPGNVSFCASNGRIGETPDFSLTANTEIRFPMDSVTPFLRGLLTYRPGFYSDRIDYDYRSREMLNLFVGLRAEDSKWEFTLFAKNVLNQKRIANISQGNAVVGTSSGVDYDSGYRTVNVTNPREFGLTGNFKF